MLIHFIVLFYECKIKEIFSFVHKVVHSPLLCSDSQSTVLRSPICWLVILFRGR